MQPNQPTTDFLEFNPTEVPLRERTWADHDEPWEYQSYHLSDLDKLRLLRRRELMLASEYNAD